MKSGLAFAAPLLLSACFPSFELPHGQGGAGTTASQSTGTTTAVVGTGAGGGGGGAGGAGPSPCGAGFQVSLGDFTDDKGSIQSIVAVNGQIIVGGYSGNEFAGVQKGFFLLVLDELEPTKPITVIPLRITGAQESEPVISLAVQNGMGTMKSLLVATSTVGTLHVERLELPLIAASPPTAVLTCDVGPGIKDGRLASNGAQVVLAAQLSLGSMTSCTVGGCSLPVTQDPSTMLLPIGESMPECDKLLVLAPETGDDTFSYPRIAMGRAKVAGPTDVALTYNAGPSNAVTHRAALVALSSNGLKYQAGTSSLIGDDALGGMPSIPIFMDELGGQLHVAGSFGPSLGLHSVFIARGTNLPVSSTQPGSSLLGANSSSLAVALDSDSGRLLFLGTLDNKGLLGLGGSAVGSCMTASCPFWGVYDDNLQLIDHQLVDPSASGGVVASAGILRCNSVLWSGSFKEPVTLVGMDKLSPNGRSAFLARRPLN